MNKKSLTHKIIQCVIVFLLGLTSFSNYTFGACTYHQSIELSELPIGIMLTWSTVLEQENRWFSVERSLDGHTFTEIGIVAGSGTSNNLKEYHFLDVQPQSGRLFFRLKQVDFDGSYQFSDVIIHDNLSSNEIHITRISDAGLHQYFELELLSSVRKQINYEIKDSQGNTIKEESISLEIGENVLKIDLEGKELGIYQVYLNTGKESDLLTLKKR